MPDQKASGSGDGGHGAPSGPDVTRPRAALFGAAHTVANVYAEGRRETIADLTDLCPTAIHDAAQRAAHLHELADVEVIFSTWGHPPLTEAELASMPRLKALFYAAGSVQGFARPLLARGVTVVSAWQVNGAMVAQFVLGQVLLACKGYYHNQRDYRASHGDRAAVFRGEGLFQTPVALLGAGAIGRRVIELLRPFSVDLMVFDPFLPDDQARRLGVRKVGLAEAFERGVVVSNHLANNAQTRGMLDGALFERLPAKATFINTGRGATVVEPELIEVLGRRPDLTALLDVTHPEPPEADSPLYELPNVYLTSHIAGAIGREVIHMADFVIEQFTRWRDGLPVEGQVHEAMLATMA